MLNSKLSSKCAESGYKSSSIKGRNLTIGGFNVDFTNFLVPFTSTVFRTVFSTVLIAGNEWRPRFHPNMDMTKILNKEGPRDVQRQLIRLPDVCFIQFLAQIKWVAVINVWEIANRTSMWIFCTKFFTTTIPSKTVQCVQTMVLLHCTRIVISWRFFSQMTLCLIGPLRQYTLLREDKEEPQLHLYFLAVSCPSTF